MKNLSNEKAHPSAIMAASVAKAVGAIEEANATGVYEAVCMRPLPQYKERYMAMLERYHDLKQKAQDLIKLANAEVQLKAKRLSHSEKQSLLAEAEAMDIYAETMKEDHAYMLHEVWRDTYHNLVVTQGKNDALDKYLAGSTYTATWYLGLISSTGYSAIVAGDTAASHAGWTESAAYAAATRPLVAFAAATGGSKTTSSAVSFAINAAGTIKGSFLISNNTKSGTTGILYSAGLFTGGDKVVDNGDTLNVTYTASL